MSLGIHRLPHIPVPLLFFYPFSRFCGSNIPALQEQILPFSTRRFLQKKFRTSGISGRLCPPILGNPLRHLCIAPSIRPDIRFFLLCSARLPRPEPPFSTTPAGQNTHNPGQREYSHPTPAKRAHSERKFSLNKARIAGIFEVPHPGVGGVGDFGDFGGRCLRVGVWVEGWGNVWGEIWVNV